MSAAHKARGATSGLHFSSVPKLHRPAVLNMGHKGQFGETADVKSAADERGREEERGQGVQAG